MTIFLESQNFLTSVTLALRGAAAVAVPSLLVDPRVRAPISGTGIVIGVTIRIWPLQKVVF